MTNIDVAPSIDARPRRRWLRWLMLGILVLFAIGLIDYFIIFPISRAKSGLSKGDAFVTQGNLPDAARAYGSVLTQYPWFTRGQQHEASRRILALFSAMKPGDAPAVRDALTFVLRTNELGPAPMIERSDPTSLLLYFDNGLDRSVDVFVDGRLAQSVPAKALRKYAYHVNGALLIETREAGKPTVIESFETQFAPGGMPCLEVRGCKDLFVAGGVPPAQVVYNIASRNSYTVQSHRYVPSDRAFSLIPETKEPTFGSRSDPDLGNARLFVVPPSIDYMLDEPVPERIEVPAAAKAAERGSLVRH